MEKIILYVDDATYACEQFAELAPDANSVVARHWVLVACAPRMTHRISKWVSHSARENWRTKWADKLFAQILPGLRAPANSVTTVVAKGPLVELTEQLQAAQPSAAQVVDARRPKSDVPEDAEKGQKAGRRWPTPRPGTLMGSLLTGFGTLWVLALE